MLAESSRRDRNFHKVDGDGAALLTYALHRCYSIPSWKLVKNAEGRYGIYRLELISR